MGAADAAVEGVVLVGVLDRVGEIAGRRVAAIGNVRGRRLGGGRVGGHRRAERAVAETVPPAPARLTGAHVGRQVVGGDPAPVVDEALDCRAVALGEERLGRVAARVEEEDRVVLREVLGGEDARVLVGVVAIGDRGDLAAVLPVVGDVRRIERILDRPDPLGDRVGVPVRDRAAVDQDVRVRALRGGRRGGHRSQSGREGKHRPPGRPPQRSSSELHPISSCPLRAHPAFLPYRMPFAPCATKIPRFSL